MLTCVEIEAVWPDFRMQLPEDDIEVSMMLLTIYEIKTDATVR